MQCNVIGNNNYQQQNMNKIDITDPQKFQLASIVIKNSRTGFASNKRLLAIRRGNLYYYSNIPKQFKGDPKILDSIHQLPKCSIQIVNIKQVKGYESTSSYFSIQFQAKHMLQREDIRKTMTLEEFNFAPKNTKEIITWQFTCDNQFIKQRWVAALEALQVYYTKQKKYIQKYFNDHQSDKKSQSSGGGRNSTKIPWRDSQVFKKNDGQVNYLKIIGADSKQKDINIKSTSPSHGNSLKPNNNTILTKPKNNQALDQQSRIRLSSATNQMKNFSPQQINIHSPRFDNKTKSSENTHEVVSVSINQFLNNIKQENSKNLAKNQTSSSLSPNKMTQSITKPFITQNKLGEKKQSQSQLNKLSESQKIIVQEIQNQAMQSPIQTPIKKFQSDSELSLNDYDQNTQNINMKKTFQEDNNTKIRANHSKQQPLKTNLFNVDSSFSDQKTPNNKNNVAIPVLNLQQRKNSIKEVILLKQAPSTKSLEKKQSINKIISHNNHQIQLKQKSFYSLHSEIFSKKYKFSTKLQIQKEFHHLIYQFKQKATKNLIQFVQGFSNFQSQSQKYQIENRSNNGMKIHFQNTYFKICFATTQNLMINGKQKIFFNEQNIKNLKREFKIYEDLWKKVILFEIKNNGNETLKLRVPLCVFLEYKGVVCLAMEEGTKENLIPTQKNSTLRQSLKSFSTQKMFLQSHGYDPTQFLYKTVQNQQYLIINLKQKINTNGAADEQSLKKNYLHQILKVKRSQKNHNMSFDPPFNQNIIIKAKKQQSSTSLQTFEKYIKTLTAISQFKGICPKEQIIQILEYCHFCKKLRKLYRSAQGQIHQIHFLNLILKKDESMMNLLTQGGCENIPIVKGVLFSFIKYYLGISCQVNEEYFNINSKNELDLETTTKSIDTPLSLALQKKQSYSSNTSKKKPEMILSAQANPIVKTYSFEQLQLFETFQNFDKYLEEGNTQLAKQALQIKKSVFWTNSTTFEKQNQLIMSHDNAKMAYNQNDFTSCLNYCQEFIEQSQKNSPHLFFIYLLMMKAYSQISEIQLTKIFQKACNLLKFNYGSHNSNFISLYCLVSYYYIKLSNNSHKTKQSDHLFQIGSKILSEADQLCLQLFGQSSKQYTDILIDLSRINQKRKTVKSLEYLQKAKFIAKSLEDKQKLLDLNIYQMKLYLNQGEIQKCQKAFDSLIQKLDDKMSNKTLIQIFNFQYELGQFSQKKMYVRQSIQNLWLIQASNAKQLAIQQAFKYSLKQNLINIQTFLQDHGSGSNGNVNNYSDRSIDISIMSTSANGNVTRAKAMLLIQENLEGHDGLLDMIKDSFEQNDEELMEAFWTIGGKKRTNKNFNKFE